MKKENLGDLCNIVIGRTPSRNIAEYWGTGYPWVSISDLKEKYIAHTKEEITQAAIEKVRCRLIPRGTLLFSFKLSLGKMAFAARDLYTNEAIAGLIIKGSKSLLPNYLFFAMKVARLLGSNQAAMGKTLNSKSLALIKVPVPEDPDDQIRIATLLSRVEALIATRKDNLRLLDEFLKSTFLEMFGDPVRNEKAFEFSLLDRFITHLTSGGRGWAKYYAETGKRFIRSLDVQMNKIGDEDNVFVIPPKNQEAERTRVQENDVLLTITGSKIGRVAYIPKGFEEAYISQHVSIIRTKGINPVYLSYYLSMPNAGQRIIKKMQYGQAKPGLNLTQIRAFQILTPGIDIQNQFVSIVEKVDSLKTLYQQSLDELENLYNALSQKAFKGELDLSRIPLEKEPEETVRATTTNLANQIAKLDSYAMSDPAAREQLLRQLFDAFIAERKGASFSLDDFWTQAEQKIADDMDEESLPLGVADYDKAKAWLFDLLKSGQAVQRFNEENNRMELDIKG